MFKTVAHSLKHKKKASRGRRKRSFDPCSTDSWIKASNDDKYRAYLHRKCSGVEPK